MTDGYKHIAERPVDPVGQPSSSGSTYINTSNQYDVAVAGLPFFLGPSKEYPYKRETAQYRKQQIDQQKEPGEQTLTGWWLRSQSSFHNVAQVIPLTPEEVVAMEEAAAQAAIDQAAREAEAARIAELKASAKAKLIAGQPFTAEEADTLVI